MTDTLYPSSSGSNIGTLLRLIQEDQNKNISNTPPGSQPGTPIRNVVQGPLQNVEAPGSSRVVSIKPEGVTQQGPQQAQQVLPPSGISPVAGTGNVIAPRAPVAPTPSGPSSSPVSAPALTQSSPNPASRVAATPSAVRAIPISTSLSLNAPKATPTKSSAPKSTPQRSSVGQPIVRTLQDLINQSFKLFPSTGLGGREAAQKALRGFA